MLGSSQEDVAPCGTLDPCSEPAALREPCQQSSIQCTTVDQLRRHGDASKDDDPVQAQQGHLGQRLILQPDAHSICLQVQYGPLGLHIERIEQFWHRSPLHCVWLL